MAINIDPRVAPYYDVTFILGALVFCGDCQREIEYTSSQPRYTDENYYEAAVAMQRAGWVVRGSCDAYCPACAARRGLSPASAPI